MKLKELFEDSSSIEQEFIDAYGDSANDVFWSAKQSVMTLISNARSVFKSAIEQDQKMKSMGVDQYTLELFLPVLKKFKFPKHASTDWARAEDDFAKHYLLKHTV